jgi:CelD/BcsL family acetyltransferase involved in cellulose biosynthesis
LTLQFIAGGRLNFGGWLIAPVAGSVPEEVGGFVTLIGSSIVETCEIIRDPAEFLALEGEWRSLFDRVPGAYLAQSFDWCWAGWETVAAPRGRRLFVLVLREEERAVLIWPLVEAKYGPCRVLRPLGTEASEYHNLLVEDGPETTRRISTAWEMLRRTPGIDMLNLANVRFDTALYGLLTQDRRCHMRAPSLLLWVRWPYATRWDGYWRSRSGHHRGAVNRKRRRLADRGRINFEVVESADRFAALVDWILPHKRAWLARRGLWNDWLFTASYREFLRLAGWRIRGRSRLVVFLLSLDGAPVAALMSCIDGKRVESLIGTFDNRYAAVSPGQTLEAECIRWALEHGLEFDFRIGGDPYKESWANERGSLATFARPLTAKGAVLVLLLRLAIRLPAPVRNRIKSALTNLVRKPGV